ncbi:MAG: creatininase family protein [Caldisphaera sp.]|uniref:creatininase family protein n=1 Tax=Caldisphaera sp. TaxID=2060322 RepID=UPI003D1201D8
MAETKKCIEYIYLKSDDINKYKNHIFVIPIGSIEQHCGLPLGLDSIIVSKIASDLCKVMNDVIIMPTIYYGFSPEWYNAKGTITLDMETFSGIIKSILNSIAKFGGKKIVFLNGHGGNSYILESVLREWISNNSETIILLINYWKVLNINIGHAGNVEKSIAKALNINIEESECNGKIDLYNGNAKIIVSGPKEESKTQEINEINLNHDDIILKIKEEIIKALNFVNEESGSFIL